ncbi:MAG: DUF5655 domain-containing protein [Ferruginibacter sp.]
MWTCPLCNRNFSKSNQVHSCLDKTLDDFLKGKSVHTTELFYYFINEYKSLGDISVYPTKSMIAITGKTRLAYIIQLGKNFMDVVFPFKQAYTDNLCFVKIKRVPGSNDYNHHFRMCFNEDINEEIKHYMKLALESLPK